MIFLVPGEDNNMAKHRRNLVVLDSPALRMFRLSKLSL
jgi:hypothetical protein